MDKRKKIEKPDKSPAQKIDPEVNPADIDEPIIKEEDPDEIPEYDPLESPATDGTHPPGEGP